MSRPVNAVPPLPWPGRGSSLGELAAFDQDLTRALHAYLSELARRANDCLPKDGSEAFTGTITGPRFRLTATDDVTLTSTLHPLQIGPTSGANLRVDADEIQAVNNGVQTLLEIQPLGTSSVTRFGSAVTGNTGIEIGGQAGVATAAHLDFHSGATAVDYDSRIIATGGTGSNGGGTLDIDAAIFSANVLRLDDPADVNLTSTLHAFQIGASAAANIAMDSNEILARNNGAIASLNLQANSGEVILHVGDASNAASLLDLRGGRIVFPATQQASTNANTLDDYEEGTWTPAFAFGGGTTGITYTRQDGLYVKIGQLVWVQARIILSAKGTSTGAATVTGMPITTASGHSYSPIAVGYYTGFSGLGGALTGYTESGSTAINLTTHGAAAVTFINETHFTNTTDLIFTCVYRASA